MAALICDQLVEGLETEVGLLAILAVLEQWHDKGPEQDLDYARVFLG